MEYGYEANRVREVKYNSEKLNTKLCTYIQLIDSVMNIQVEYNVQDRQYKDLDYTQPVIHRI